MADLQTTNKNTPQSFIKDLNVQKMITDRLGKRAGQFTTSLLSLVNANKNIAECTPVTIVQAALTAASMDLPINQNLGFAYIVPYRNKGTMEAQFQMGWKGFVQLAQRSGKFQTINTTDVREGEVKTRDRLTGELEFNWINDDDERSAAPIVGYLAYFKLLNGFSKSSYMTKAEIENHAGRYSQSFKSGYNSPWKTDFDLMAQKTVLKLLLNKFAPLSTEMQEAIAVDQSVDDGSGRRFIDNDQDDAVKASSEAVDAIVAANVPDGVDPETGEIIEAEIVEPVKKSAKDIAAERFSKQGKLVDDDSRSRSNPGN